MIRLLTTTALFAAGLLLAPGSFAQTSQPNAPSRAAPAGTATEALNQEDRRESSTRHLVTQIEGFMTYQERSLGVSRNLGEAEENGY